MSNEELDPYAVDTEPLPEWTKEQPVGRSGAKSERAKPTKREYDPGVCPTCKKDFTPTHGLQRYCDSVCKEHHPDRLEYNRKLGREGYREKMRAQGHIVKTMDHIKRKTKAEKLEIAKRRYEYMAERCEASRVRYEAAKIEAKNGGSSDD